jgi:hypothetical protein|tara:strand:+ start:1759 stop:2700 length:942 start_codon:yes stop_codon:yes gene_type:complete
MGQNEVVTVPLERLAEGIPGFTGGEVTAFTTSEPLSLHQVTSNLSKLANHGSSRELQLGESAQQYGTEVRIQQDWKHEDAYLLVAVRSPERVDIASNDQTVGTLQSEVEGHRGSLLRVLLPYDLGGLNGLSPYVNDTEHPTRFQDEGIDVPATIAHGSNQLTAYFEGPVDAGYLFFVKDLKPDTGTGFAVRPTGRALAAALTGDQEGCYLDGSMIFGLAQGTIIATQYPVDSWDAAEKLALNGRTSLRPVDSENDVLLYAVGDEQVRVSGSQHPEAGENLQRQVSLFHITPGIDPVRGSYRLLHMEKQLLDLS